MNTACARVLGAALLLLAPASATAAAPDTTGVELPALTVTGTAPGTGAVPRSWLDRHDDGHLGETLEHLPGVWAVRRAASGTEPVIRGLGFERVQTRLGAVPLHGACPGRMDPPVTYLSGLSYDRLTVTRGAGARAGAGGLAGTILADPDFERDPHAPAGYVTFVGGGYDGARHGYRAEAGVTGGDELLDLRAGAGLRRADDYTAPDGRTVPASLTTASAHLSLGLRPAAHQRLWGAVNYVREQDVEYTALPMDNRETDFLAVNLGWRLVTGGDRVELTGGYSSVDHLMDNAGRANFPMLEASTPAATRTWALRAVYATGTKLGELELGSDLTGVSKDAVRERLVKMPSPGRFSDHIWPDAEQVTFGHWLRLARDLSGDLRLTVDGRFDTAASRARAADDPSLGGLTVREQYARYYGDDAAVTDVVENLGQASLRLDGALGAHLAWRGRTGLAARAAGLTERYNAFGPAPGGFVVGNPALAPEKAWQSELGLNLGAGRIGLDLAVFHTRIADHVLPTLVDRRDVDGDGRPDAVKGFLNRDATLTGGELALEYRPGPRLRVPASLACVRGRNTTDGRDLPEIPALSGSLAVRGRIHAGTATWLVAGLRFAADQERIDPVFGEDRTGGWSVWRLGLEARPVDGLRLRVGVENLFDRQYHDHLTREAVLPVGDLAQGDEVPAPGRSLQVSARWEM